MTTEVHAGQVNTTPVAFWADEEGYDVIRIVVPSTGVFVFSDQAAADTSGALQSGEEESDEILQGLARSFIRAYCRSGTSSTDREHARDSVDHSDADAAPIEARLRWLLFEARDIRFEDGMDNAFSKGVSELVSLYGATAIHVLRRHWRVMAKLNPEEFGEILVTLGRMEHESTKDLRRSLIEDALTHSDPGIRDSAILGLDILDDPASEVALRRALEGEDVPLIKHTLAAMLWGIH